MSHFTKAMTSLRDAALVKKSLASMGYEVLNGANVAGWLGQTTNSDFKIRVKGRSNYEIGFVKSSSGYEVVSDWSMNGLNQSAFLKELSRAYGREAALHTLEEQGFHVESETATKQEIRIVFRR